MVTGAEGVLGREVVRVLRERQVEALGLSHAALNVTDETAVRALMDRIHPNAVVHCAGMCDALAAEKDPALCVTMNAHSTLYLARSCRRLGARMLYVSTAEVFRGNVGSVCETSDVPRPVNVYGLSKVQGEEAMRATLSRYIVVRMGMLLSDRPHGIIRRTLDQTASRARIALPRDPITPPAAPLDAARAIVSLLLADRAGTWHLSGEGECTMASLGAAILSLAGSRCKLQANCEGKSSFLYPAAPVVLGKRGQEHMGFLRLPPWEEALEKVMTELGLTALK